MTAQFYAVVQTASGMVDNVIIWDGVTPYDLNPGEEAVAFPSDGDAGIGYTYASGTFTPPAAPTLSAAQISQNAYAALISGGLTITSTGTSALNGVYPIDPQSQSDIATEAQFISTFSEFTTGATTNLPWAQTSGTFVQWPTTTEFLAFAKAAAQLVAAAKLALAQGAAMPSAAATVP